VTSFRPLAHDDLPLLAGWQAQPHVARWWREDAGLAAVTARYLPSLEGRDPTELFVIEVDGTAAGFIQRYLVAVSQGNAASWRALEKAGFTRCWAGDLATDDPLRRRTDVPLPQTSPPPGDRAGLTCRSRRRIRFSPRCAPRWQPIHVIL
jgi:RimJ/RimL family protein N-acetyltransferase